MPYKDKEKHKEHCKLYYRLNKDKKRKYNKEYYQENFDSRNKSKKEWAKANKDKLLIYKRKQIILYPEKYEARIIARAIIPLKESCEICGSNKQLERHHWNYKQPLNVSTLCNICHNIQHHKNYVRVEEELPSQI